MSDDLLTNLNVLRHLQKLNGLLRKGRGYMTKLTREKKKLLQCVKYMQPFMIWKTKQGDKQEENKQDSNDQKTETENTANPNNSGQQQQTSDTPAGEPTAPAASSEQPPAQSTSDVNSALNNKQETPPAGTPSKVQQSTFPMPYVPQATGACTEEQEIEIKL